MPKRVHLPGNPWLNIKCFQQKFMTFCDLKPNSKCKSITCFNFGKHIIPKKKKKCTWSIIKSKLTVASSFCTQPPPTNSNCLFSTKVLNLFLTSIGCSCHQSLKNELHNPRKTNTIIKSKFIQSKKKEKN